MQSLFYAVRFGFPRVLVLAACLLAAATGVRAETAYVNDFNGVRAYDLTEQPAAATLIFGTEELGNSGFITIGPDGSVYVIDRGSAGDLMDVVRFSPSGELIERLVTSSGLTLATAIRFGPGGDLFVLDKGASSGFAAKVVRFDGTTGASKGTYTSGLVLDYFVEDLEFDSTGRLYVSELLREGGAAIHRFASGGAFEATVVRDRNAVAGDLMFGPRGLRMGPDDALYIVDHHDHVVWRYDPITDLVSKYADAPSDPHFIDFGSDGTAYSMPRGPAGCCPSAATWAVPPAPRVPALPQICPVILRWPLVLPT